VEEVVFSIDSYNNKKQSCSMIYGDEEDDYYGQYSLLHPKVYIFKLSFLFIVLFLNNGLQIYNFNLS
jgi:hypothetical protein